MADPPAPASAAVATAAASATPETWAWSRGGPVQAPKEDSAYLKPHEKRQLRDAKVTEKRVARAGEFSLEALHDDMLAGSLMPLTVGPLPKHALGEVQHLARLMRYDAAVSGKKATLTPTGSPPDVQQLAAARAIVERWRAAAEGARSTELLDVGTARRTAGRGGKARRPHEPRETLRTPAQVGKDEKRRQRRRARGTGVAAEAASLGMGYFEPAMTSVGGGGASAPRPDSGTDDSASSLATGTEEDGDDEGSDSSSDAPVAGVGADDSEVAAIASAVSQLATIATTDTAHKGGDDVATLASDSATRDDSAAPTVPDELRGSWEGHTRGVGSRLLSKMGFKGGTLGKRVGGDGTAPSPMAEPLDPQQRANRLGLGADG